MDALEELQKQKDAIWYLYYNDILTEKETLDCLNLWKEKFIYYKTKKKSNLENLLRNEELEIEEKLQEKYQNIIIEVTFKDFRVYEIVVKIEYSNTIYESKFEYKYDNSLTIDTNINTIEHIIDNKIILPFYKRGE